MTDLPNMAQLWQAWGKNGTLNKQLQEQRRVLQDFLRQTLLCLSSLLAAQDQLHTTIYAGTAAGLQAIVPGGYSK